MIHRSIALLLCTCVLVAFPLLSTHGATASVPEQPAGIDIRGIVSDSSTGERIVGVNVAVQGTQRGATTNAHGFYLIPSVAGGQQEIIFSAVGYERRSVRINVGGTEPISLNVKLLPRVIESTEVLVESQRIASLEARSASLHILTPKLMQQLPSVAQQDLLRSLQMLPGISSTSDVSAKFYVRGGAGDQNLILLDGMKIYNPYHAFGLFSVLDPDIVKSADVYTGAFPAEYGGKLSSVVNVQTKDGNLSGISGVANINFLSGKLELDGPLSDDNAWLISGRTSLFGGSLNRIIPNPAPTTFYDMFFKATAGTSTGRLGFRGYISSDDVTPSATDQPDHSWRNAAGSVVLSGLLTDRSYYDASISYSLAQIKRTAKPGSSVLPQSSQLEDVTLHVEVSSIGEDQQTLSEGFEFSFPSIDDSLYVSGVYPARVKDSQVEWSMWARYEGTWGDLRYDLGVHGDLALLFEGAEVRQGIQPRITLSYPLSATWIAKASYGVFTQRLITINNENDLISLFDAWVFLPPNITTEEAHHYVAGVEGNLLVNLSASLQAYYKDYPSLALYNTAKVFADDADYLDGTGNAWGVESLLRYTSRLFDLFGSYSWAKTTVSVNGLEYAPRYDRRHTVKAIGTLHLFDNLDFTLRWEYGSGYPFTQNAGYYSRLTLADISETDSPYGSGIVSRVLGVKNAARLPAYRRLDAGVNYRIPLAGSVRGTIGASVINVFDAKNILYYDRLTGKTDYMTPFFPTASLSVEF